MPYSKFKKEFFQLMKSQGGKIIKFIRSNSVNVNILNKNLNKFLYKIKFLYDIFVKTKQMIITSKKLTKKSSLMPEN